MDRETSDFYRLRGAEWAEHLPHEWSGALDPFLDLLQPGARILELGCGDGRDAARMAARGFDVLATDGVPEMVELASARIGGRAVVMRFEELEAEEKFDAVWAHASLLHVERESLPAILARVWRALKPGGWHHASYKGGEAGHRDEFGRYYNYMSEAPLREAYGTCDWASLTFELSQGGSFGGAPTEWLDVTARR